MGTTAGRRGGGLHVAVKKTDVRFQILFLLRREPRADESGLVG